MRAQPLTHLLLGGSSLLPVLVLTGSTLLVVVAVLNWSSANIRFTQRQNQYLDSMAAAEAATEQVISHLSRDFQESGDSGVSDNLAGYRQLCPASLGGTVAGNLGAIFQFSDGQGHVNQTYVDQLSLWEYRALETKRPGLNGHTSTYRIISNARELNTPYHSVAAIRQDVQLASIPVFQFQLFYGLDMEFSPGANNMAITGPVHCNRTIYCEPNARSVTFLASVTAARQILHQKHPADPVVRTFGSVVYQGGRESWVNTLNLPLGTNSGSSELRGVVTLPPEAEPPDSLLGQQRYYNKAELILLVSNDTVVAKSGRYNGFSVSIPWTNLAEVVSVTGGHGKDRDVRQLRRQNPSTYDGIVSTNVTFFNKRQNKTVRATEIDIGQLLARYPYLTSVLGREVKSIYVADFRSQISTTQSGVRLVIGETLPAHGLTVATPNPLYVVGNYNVPAGAAGTTNTSQTAPASLVADSIAILSENWLDANGGASLSNRRAINTTVNAAILAGIVPTGGGYYSGGVENFPRLMEDWSGLSLTMNGSMVVLYESQIATAPWGAAPDIYNPPVRSWNFDVNFREESKLPPGTPELRTLIRSAWAMIQPGSIQ